MYNVTVTHIATKKGTKFKYKTAITGNKTQLLVMTIEQIHDISEIHIHLLICKPHLS